ncbi:MAG: transglycosylase SLT domain-containing protein [Bacteroidota bacterium]
MINKAIFFFIFLVTVLIFCSDNHSGDDYGMVKSGEADLTAVGLIRDKTGLAEKTIYAMKRSSPGEQLVSLAGEICDSISIVEVPYDSEKLFKDVANGEINYAVREENVEMANAKYFRNSRSGMIVKSDFYTSNTRKISQYDDLIRKFSQSIKWDWRLLASLIFQESRFEPNVKSWAGAYGLMQIMPVTGRHFGIDVTSSPENNMKAGILYINWLHKIFDPKIYDENERLNFILASYNAGPGHILDAMKLAEKNGMNPQKWEGNVAIWLKNKSDPRYYNDIVVKCGYFRGTESVNFVSEVRDRFEKYKSIIPEEKNNPF